MLLCPHSHANLYAILPAGVDSDPLRNGFSATSLDEDEVERLLDACIRHSDYWSGFKVAAMVLLGTSMGFRGWLFCLLLYEDYNGLLMCMPATHSTMSQATTSWTQSSVFWH